MENKQVLHFKKTIITLSLIALGCAVFNFISGFITRSKYESVTVDYIIFSIIEFAPVVLFVIYLLKFHHEGKATFLVPTMFGLISFLHMSYVIRYWLRSIGFSTSHWMSYWWMFDGDMQIIVFAFSFAFALATISALKGFSKKIFLIIAVAVGLLLQVCSIIYSLWYFSYTWTIRTLGEISFYIALLLFGLKSHIPHIISVSPEKEKKKIENMSPGQALKRLNKDLKLGIFTEEEYQLLRNDIISKL